MPDRPPSSDDAIAGFFTQLLREAAGEGLDLSRDGALQALGGPLWEWASGLEAGARGVRLRPAPPELGGQGSLLEAAGPDIPFLVASLLGECTEQGHDVRALLHPVVDRGDGPARSLIQIHLPLLTEPEQSRLRAGAEATLQDVAAAVADYGALKARLSEEIERLEARADLDPELRDEAVAFLAWLRDEHFVFIGARTYDFAKGADGALLPEEPIMIEGSNLGVLRDEERNVLNQGSEPTVLTAEIQAFLQEPSPLIIAKSTMVSRVHRRVPADYVGVKRYDAAGAVCGETRFVGLFTAEAYDERAARTPLLRRRIRKVQAAIGAKPGGHTAQAISHILEAWPRDELFQTHSRDLIPMVEGALHLIGRPRTRVFLRRDEFDRFVSALVYVAREDYNSELRKRIGDILSSALNGSISSFQPSFDTADLARVHFVVDLKDPTVEYDAAEIEAAIIAAARGWAEAFRDALAAAELSEPARAGASRFHGAFNAAYREAFPAEEALVDVAEIAELSANAPIRLRAFRRPGDKSSDIRAKIYARGVSVPLSRCVPVFENMGLFVHFETGYPIRPSEKPAPDAPDTYWIHDLAMCVGETADIDLERIKSGFEAAFAAIWTGLAENDGFNRLVLDPGADWREASLLRALCAYRAQSGLDPAQPTQIEALARHTNLTRRLLELFATRFDPSLTIDRETRAAKAHEMRADIDHHLIDVASLDHDRVVRRLADLIMAIQRTNFYQNQADAIAFKVASRDLAELPYPKPYREIFVASPRVAGAHLRFGPVARGGLRWSDRRDDFRTEVLGLVKAQQVKNAVIVPVGSKGGFFPKQLPPGGSRDAVRAEAVAAYKVFIDGLLSLTDNIVQGEVRPPADMVAWDGEDPYLVVAADKGTATFSDIANEISESLGFWLGDAFASGGSAGYDHKKMGITARGAWEAVKRHFRELGKDIQADPFTVIGVGDMSGDVFGNGMLLSKQIRLLAAFNHLHVFVDPDPADPERAWAERKRLFDLPRSAWSDYDPSLISPGGGVFDRSAKSIELSDEIRRMTGLNAKAATPDELIHALLKADCELLWFGGIGTYVKASGETHADVGDRGNDGVRVNASELRAKVVGEGANLGITQAARIAYARAGGRINTDAIDNSAGVDSSDHEVNIKILVGDAIRRGRLPKGERNSLLASMTDDVAAHVLAHNYAQTGALSLAAATADVDHEACERLMERLEARGVLDRAVEGLPASDEMMSRGAAGDWLTRPELSVLMAWSKITLFDDLIASSVPDDLYFDTVLQGYFPEAVRPLKDVMRSHRLKREIIATVLANRSIDAIGPVGMLRLQETTALGSAEIVRGLEAARAVLKAGDIGRSIDALDNKAPADLQTELKGAMAAALSAMAAWFARHGAGRPVGELVSNYSFVLEPGPADSLSGLLSPFEAARLERAARRFAADGAPADFARRMASLPILALAPEVIETASAAGADRLETARAFFAVGGALGLDRLRAAAFESLSGAPYWDRLATRGLIDDLLRQQSAAARQALANGTPMEAWLADRKDALERLNARIRRIGAGQNWTFAKFALAADAVRAFMAGAE